MFEFEMFLGFPHTPAFTRAAAQVDPKIIKLFIGNSEEYLKHVVHQGVAYWGKSIGEIADIDKLELMESNIYSLLKKIIPDYPYTDVPLLVFPLNIQTT